MKKIYIISCLLFLYGMTYAQLDQLITLKEKLADLENNLKRPGKPQRTQESMLEQQKQMEYELTQQRLAQLAKKVEKKGKKLKSPSVREKEKEREELPEEVEEQPSKEMEQFRAIAAEVAAQKEEKAKKAKAEKKLRKRRKKTPTEESTQKFVEMPTELVEMFALELIPDSIDTAEDLIRTLKNLDNFAFTKELNAYVIRDSSNVRRKLLGSITSADVVREVADSELKEIQFVPLNQLIKLLKTVTQSYSARELKDEKIVKEWADAVFKLIKHGLSPRIIFDDPNFAGILIEIFGNNFSLAKALLDQGLNPNMYVADETLLYIALKGSRYKMAQYDIAIELLDHGANPSLPPIKNSNEPYFIRMKLVDFTSENTNIINFIKKAVQKGLNPNTLFKSPNDRGYGSLLFYAIEIRNISLVDFLLMNGADPNLNVLFDAYDQNIHTALQAAQSQLQIDIKNNYEEKIALDKEIISLLESK